MHQRHIVVSGARSGTGRFARVGAVAILALAALSATPGRAAEWEWGELRARLDSFVTLSLTMRTDNRDCRQIATVNGGCGVSGVNLPALDLVTLEGRLLNSDDGNLNWDRGDVFSVLGSASHDLQLTWRNYGAFVRVLYFFDAIQSNESSTRRTDLDREARYRRNLTEGGVVGADFRFLDAYGYGGFEVGDRQVEVKFGNQVVNWGEEFFTQGGIKVTNAFDVTKLRTAGSELKEGLVPAPILRVSGDLLGPLTLDTYYQFYWNKTEIDPVGTFYSINDLVGRGAQGLFTGAVLRPLPITPLAPDPLGDPGTRGLTPEEIFALGGNSYGGLPKERDRDAKSQGQWGAALRYYLDAIETEFAGYYVRFHDKQPTVSFRGTPLTVNPPSNFQTCTGCTYFREFVEDIDVYGVSMSTVLGGVALGFETSYRPRAPTPVADALPFLFAQTPGVPIEVSGFRREKRWMFIANALYLAGPGTPLLGDLLRWIGAEDMTLIGEAAMVSYPDLSDRVLYAVPIGVTQSAPSGFYPGANTRLEKRSWGYQLRISATYSRAFGTAITLTPTVAFRHDVDGVTPDFGVQFNEDLKQVALQLQADYLTRWRGLVTYSNSWGAGRANVNNDRDFLQFSISYSF